MKLRYLVLLAVAVLGLAFGRQPEAALAQTDNQTPAFKNVTLWLNPEYDDPRLLVMMEGKLASGTAPVQVSFLVPESAEMYSAGSKDAQGRYSGGPPDRKASTTTERPGWDVISYTLKTDTFRVEYYAPLIQGYPDKTVSYDFHTISPISDLRVYVQQPKKSTNFTVTPKGSAGADDEGFTVYSSSYTNLNAETSLHFDIVYTREETKPALSSPSSVGSSNYSYVWWILGVLVVGGAIVWFLKSQQAERVPVSGKRRERRQAARQRRSSGNRFCTNCGQPLDASDKFCPSCGDKVRD